MNAVEPNSLNYHTEKMPIVSEEIIALSTLGVTGVKNCSLTSGEWLSVVEPSKNSLTLVDIVKKTAERRKVTADAAAIHPDGNILALRCDNVVQIFDLKNKRRIKSAELSSNHVSLWEWVNDHILAIVMDKDVLHLSLSGSNEPEVVMSRNPAILSGAAINYCVSINMKWMLLTTVSVENDRMVGHIQLQSVEHARCQIVEADAAGFAAFKLRKNSAPSDLLVFAKTKDRTLCIAPMGKPVDGDEPFIRITTGLHMPEDSDGDFPVAIEVDNSAGIIFVVWKYGSIVLHDIEVGAVLYSTAICSSAILATVYQKSGALLALNKQGQLFKVEVAINSLITHLEHEQDINLAVQLALRVNFLKADHIFHKRFDQLMEKGSAKEAAYLAAHAPNCTLRNQQVVEKLGEASVVSGMTPLMTYFGELLNKGRLLDWEAVELCRPAITQRRFDLLEKWLREDRLECSQILGEMILPFNTTLALSVFVRAGEVSRAISCFAKKGQFQQLLEYAQKMSNVPDFLSLIETLLKENVMNVSAFALAIVADGKFTLDVIRVVDMYVEKGLIEESIQLLNQAIEKNNPNLAQLETRLLCLHVQYDPVYADSLLGSKTFLNFDAQIVAHSCEFNGLLQRALELYSELSDWLRVLAKAKSFDIEKLTKFFSSLDSIHIMPCLRALLESNLSENMNAAVQIAVTSATKVSCSSLIELFEEHKADNALFTFLCHVVVESEEQVIHFKFVVTAVKLGHWAQLTSFCKKSEHMNAVVVRTFLMEACLDNLQPLFVICQRFNFISELVDYLICRDRLHQIKSYVTEFDSSSFVKVLECLLNRNVDDNTINSVVSLAGVGMVEEVIAVMEKHNRLPLLSSWLEQLPISSIENEVAQTALAKIAIVTNCNPEFYLEEKYYDFCAVGAFCEQFNPELAVIAYGRGNCDSALMKVCIHHGLIKAAARHLLRRCDISLWIQVFSDEVLKIPCLIENVIHLITSENYSHEEIACVVKALSNSNMQKELLPLLETLVFDCQQFSNHSNLQNLLILSAMKAEPSRVKELIATLMNYDALNVAEIAIQSNLFDEALYIYERAGKSTKALELIIDKIGDWEKAAALAKKCDCSEAWAYFGRKLIEDGQLKRGIDALILAGDASMYQIVLKETSEAGLWREQAKYLESARRTVMVPVIDESLIYVYAKTQRLEDLEQFLLSLHVANVLLVGERCQCDNLLEAAEILFKNINCYGRLAETLAERGNLAEAVASAKKAGNLQSWCKILDIALEKNDLDAAIVAARQRLAFSAEIEAIVNKFESKGFFEEIIQLLESMVTSDNNNSTLFTALAFLYIRYRPEKCRSYIELWWERLHIPFVLKALQEALMWEELALLLEIHQDYCEAIAVIMEHPTEAWHHTRFKDLLSKVINIHFVQGVIEFYIKYKPLLLNDLLLSLGFRLDSGRVITALRNVGHLALGRPFLETRLAEDNAAVNAALCELLIEEENHIGLRSLVSSQKNINDAALACSLESHDVLGFRLVSVDLFRRCHRWLDAIRECRRDKLYREAIEVAAESKDPQLVAQMLQDFLKEKRYDSFSAALLHCYKLLEPDFVTELAWKYDAWCYAMPYFIQVIQNLNMEYKNFSSRLAALEAKLNKSKENSPKTNEQKMLTWLPLD